MKIFPIPTEWIFIILAVGAMFLPYILLWHEERISAEQLRALRPDVKWLVWAQPLLMLAWFAFLFLGIMGYIPNIITGIMEKNMILLAAVFLLGTEFTSGILAAISGVYTLSRRRRLGYTRYVNSDKARLTGLVQVLVDGALLVGIFLLVM